MTQRSRSSITALAACGVLVVGLCALLVLWDADSDPQGADLEPVVSLDGTLPLRGAADELEGHRRDAVADAARDRRAALEHEPAVEAASDIDVDALPAGELEVVVRLGARAADSRPADGWVALQRLEGNDLATPFDPALTIEAPLENGVARFEDLPRGVLLLGVHVGPGPPLRTTWVNSRVRGARLEFRLGDTRLHGWVRDSSGAAAHGARVWITGRQGAVVASCAPDGSYDGGGVLPAGRFEVRVEGHPIADVSPRRTVDLQPGSVREVSFGPGGDLARWTGRVLAPDGSLVSAADGLPANAVQLAARGGRGRVFDVEVVDGAIDRWFERDVYALRFVEDGAPVRATRFDDVLDRSPGRGYQSAHDTIDLNSDLVRDVLLAGFVLTGRVDIDTSAAANGASPSVELRSAHVFDGLRATVGADGTFRFVALEPGTYELHSSGAETAFVAIDARGPTVVEVEPIQD
ncbi:hypothetical protein Pla163_00910 [Planctomycetes bacterium Pla163]|uniref:Uncharacterized protein n=1 Tax=Rohdeia mirabilis TaxID=2528008 RepID=A0A518CUU0_9BACT|nr:hypothetical protein Pla163_00910 [Planctomycetes bacterium Pla163]